MKLKNDNFRDGEYHLKNETVIENNKNTEEIEKPKKKRKKGEK